MNYTFSYKSCSYLVFLVYPNLRSCHVSLFSDGTFESDPELQIYCTLVERVTTFQMPPHLALGPLNSTSSIIEDLLSRGLRSCMRCLESSMVYR
jgi:hypothetical protein